MTTWFCRDLARLMLVRAAKQLPESLREDLLEDWLGNLDHLPGGFSQLRWALPLALWGARGVAARTATAGHSSVPFFDAALGALARVVLIHGPSRWLPHRSVLVRKWLRDIDHLPGCTKLLRAIRLVLWGETSEQRVFIRSERLGSFAVLVMCVIGFPSLIPGILLSSYLLPDRHWAVAVLSFAFCMTVFFTVGALLSWIFGLAGAEVAGFSDGRPMGHGKARSSRLTN